ncbi:MAG: 30S ribosomal protein S17 [Candidatus Dependentiae bacterium]|nr:30S ribosomal protein S17 [Candidatus Dependentiae bacterium]
MTTEQKIRRVLSGKVVSDKMDKTIVVKTVSTFMDPLFHKIRKKNKNYKVHDEQGLAKSGDLVEFYEGRPVSKSKYMYLARVITSQQG